MQFVSGTEAGDSGWRAIIAMLLCPHWWIWCITIILISTCQFFKTKNWWQYLTKWAEIALTITYTYVTALTVQSWFHAKSEIELVQITRRNSWTMIRMLLIHLGDVILNRKYQTEISISDGNIYIKRKRRWNASFICWTCILIWARWGPWWCHHREVPILLHRR